MATKKRRLSRLAKALLAMAADMRKTGLLDDATYRKITLRHVGRKR